MALIASWSLYCSLITLKCLGLKIGGLNSGKVYWIIEWFWCNFAVRESAREGKFITAA